MNEHLAVKIMRRIMLFCCVVCCISITTGSAQNVVLEHAHAHNDYLQPNPLTGALQLRFSSIEADVFPKKHHLEVAHILPALYGKGELEELYLRPLHERAIKNGNRIYPLPSKALILLIDLKSDGEKCYKLLLPLLEKYKDLLSYEENGIFHEQAVTIVLSGKKPINAVSGEKIKRVFIDCALEKLNEPLVEAELYKMASANYRNYFSKRHPPNATELANFKKLVDNAANYALPVRLWNIPAKEDIWEKLLGAGLELISTDQQEKLSDFLRKKAQ